MNALILGSVWTVLGFAYLLFLTKGFKVQPPEIDMSYADESSNHIQEETNQNSSVDSSFVKK